MIGSPIVEDAEEDDDFMDFVTQQTDNNNSMNLNATNSFGNSKIDWSFPSIKIPAPKIGMLSKRSEELIDIDGIKSPRSSAMNKENETKDNEFKDEKSQKNNNDSNNNSDSKLSPMQEEKLKKKEFITGLLLNNDNALGSDLIKKSSNKSSPRTPNRITDSDIDDMSKMDKQMQTQNSSNNNQKLLKALPISEQQSLMLDEESSDEEKTPPVKQNTTKGRHKR